MSWTTLNTCFTARKSQGSFGFIWILISPEVFRRSMLSKSSEVISTSVFPQCLHSALFSKTEFHVLQCLHLISFVSIGIIGLVLGLFIF
jgi:hypothetical protein